MKMAIIVALSFFGVFEAVANSSHSPLAAGGVASRPCEVQTGSKHVRPHKFIRHPVNSAEDAIQSAREQIYGLWFDRPRNWRPDVVERSGDIWILSEGNMMIWRLSAKDGCILGWSVF